MSIVFIIHIWMWSISPCRVSTRAMLFIQNQKKVSQTNQVITMTFCSKEHDNIARTHLGEGENCLPYSLMQSCFPYNWSVSVDKHSLPIWGVEWRESQVISTGATKKTLSTADEGPPSFRRLVADLKVGVCVCACWENELLFHIILIIEIRTYKRERITKLGKRSFA